MTHRVLMMSKICKIPNESENSRFYKSQNDSCWNIRKVLASSLRFEFWFNFKWIKSDRVVVIINFLLESLALDLNCPEIQNS